ncbi:MAG: SgcJ/EcaC family oxidoreductase [Pirellulales bacterium]|nr:SgcJ/EcaC family oxidoreductase [Pirellulales bacterium]
MSQYSISQRLKSWRLVALIGLALVTPVMADDDPEATAIAAVKSSHEQVLKSFNEGKADAVAAAFLPQGELIDEAGVIYRGNEEIKSILTSFFERYAGVKLALDIETVRLVGPVAIEEGTRAMTTADGEETSRFRYIAVWAKPEKQWRLASFRDFAETPTLSPHDHLQALSWLVGDWLNEGADGRVAINYHWSDDKNYLLGDYAYESAEGEQRKSTHRIGWDPAAGQIRSWLFDADGGFAVGGWTMVDDGAVIKSESVNPDGTTSHVTLHIIVKDEDHFAIEGVDRIIGDSLAEDFDITVTRRPEAVGK